MINKRTLLTILICLAVSFGVEPAFAAYNAKIHGRTATKALYHDDFSQDLSRWSVERANGANWTIENGGITSGPVDTWNAEQETIIVFNSRISEDEYTVSFDATESRYGGMASLVFGYQSPDRFYSLRMLNIEDVDYIGFYKRYDVSLWQEERLTLAKFPGGKREPGRTYTISVSVSGNELKGCVNGIPVTEYTLPADEVLGDRCGIFQSYGHPIYDNFSVSVSYEPDVQFSRDLKLMASLGLLWDTDKHIGPDEYITKGQAEHFVSKLTNKPHTYSDESSAETISCTAASEYFLNALGYDKISAESVYHSVKNQLLTGVDSTSNAVSIKDFFKIAINSFEIDMVFTDYGRRSYHIKKDVNVLTYFHNVYKNKSVITGNGITSIDAVDTIGAEYVTFENGFEAVVGGTDIGSYVGYGVQYYYKNTHTPEILFFDVLSDYEQFLYADEIEAYKNGYIHYCLREENELQKIKVPENAICIYNGVYLPGADSSDFIPESGYITIIKNGRADFSDVVIVWEYTDLLVDSVSVGENKIYDKLSDRVIELDACQSWSLLNEFSEEITISDINENYIVSAAFSKDKKTLTAIVNTASKIGMVEKISQTDGSVRFGGVDYVLSNDFFENSKISVGDVGTLYVNMTDRAIYFQHEKSESLKAAYLIKTVQENGLDSRLRMCIFDGEIQDMRCGEAVKINNKTYRGDNIYPQILNYCGVIEYKTNAKGEISQIMFPRGHDIGRNDGDLIRMSSFTGSRIYKSDIRSFGGVFIAEENAKVFLVPYDRSRLDEYRLTDMSYFKNDTNYHYLIAYSHGDNLERAEIIESEFNDKPQYLLQGACILENMYEELDENDARCTMLKVRHDVNDVKTIALADYCEPGELEIGDIFQYSVNIDGKADEIVRVFDHKSGEFFHYGNADFNASYRMLYGTIEELRANSFVFRYGDKTEIVVPSCPVLLYDSSSRGEKFRTCSVRDIRDEAYYGLDADKILIRFEYGIAKEIIIYR